MDIIDIAIAKSKATAVDPSDISSAVSEYLDEHGVQVQVDSNLSSTSENAVQNKVINNTIGLITVSISGLQNSMNQKANKTDVQSLTDTVNTISEDITEVSDSLDSYLDSWEDIYSFWQAGYYYDADNDYTYTQISTDERAWSEMVVVDTTYCTPNDKLISVVTGEHYKVKGAPVYMDSKKHFVPSVVFFDTNKSPIDGLWLRETVGDPDRSTMEFEIPDNAEYMAVVGIDNIYKRVHDSLDRNNILNAIDSNYRLCKTSKKIKPNMTFDKGYICIGIDDLRNAQTKHLHDMLTAYNLPYYIAAIPSNAKRCVIGDPYHTNLDYMKMCVDNGGEIITHNASAIIESNANDFDFLYRYFYQSKKELEFYGFSPKGIYKAGDTNAIDTNTKQYESWTSYFYNFGDLFSPTNTYPYRMERQCLEWLTEANIDALVTKICVNHEPVNFFTHSNESDNEFAYLMEKLSEYTRGVDYEFITPSQLYDMIMSSQSSSDITIDTELKADSANPVTNSAIYSAFNDVATYINATIGDIKSALEELRGGSKSEK